MTKQPFESVIRLDEVPGSVAITLRDESTKIVRWITDPNNVVEPPICRLFTTFIDSGADELGLARNVIARLPDSAARCYRDPSALLLGSGLGNAKSRQIGVFQTKNLSQFVPSLLWEHVKHRQIQTQNTTKPNLSQNAPPLVVP